MRNNSLRFPRLAAVSISCLFALGGCDYFKKEHYDKLSENLEALRKQVADIASDPSKTADEVKKLREFEYKVFEISETAGSPEIEKTLNKFGKEYWDCYHVERHVVRYPQESETEIRQPLLRFFCKRQPFTPLRLLVR